ncbi:MAG: N-6 DNA methylase [Anaerolineaceae bacterium]|nr:N-6 DNA methylase [Anaerolineaceae bacterium]
MLDADTKQRIDKARKILVGVLPMPQAQIDQITYALIYKFMDDMDQQSVSIGGKASFFTDEFAKYAWTRIFNPRLGGFELHTLYTDALAAIPRNPNIPQFIRTVFKNALLPYRNPETLKLFLKTINEFQYSQNDHLGDAFEYLLQTLGSQGDAGQFLTPRHIINFMVEVVDPQKHETILDPACGTAGFLISSYLHILNQNQKNVPGDLLTAAERASLPANFTGYDISSEMVRLALTNLYLHGFTNPHILEYDSLTSEDHWDEYFNVILANPPFMSPTGGIRPHKKFSVQANRSEVLFVDYIAEHLTPSGRAAIIVPEGIIFQSGNAYKKLRKMLVEQNYLWAVVSLPAGVFNPYAGVKTSILFLDKELARKTDQVVFIKIENDGFSLGANRTPINKNDLPVAIESLKSWQEKIQQVLVPHPSFEINTNPQLDSFSTNKSLIANDGNYHLSVDKYKKDIKIDKYSYPTYELGELAEIISGQSPEGKYYNEIRLGLPFYQGKVEFTERFIGKPRIWTSKVTKIAEPFDILMSVRAPVGPVNIATEKMCIGRGLAAIRANSELVLWEYLFEYLRSIQNEIVGNSGAVFASINRDDIAKIKIPLPPLEVQHEIVAEIEGYQRIIDGARQVVDNWQPNLEHELELARKQAGVAEWEKVKLGDVCIVKGGKRLPKGTSFANKVSSHPYLRVVDFQRGSVNNQNLKYIDDEVFSSIKNYTISKDDVYISIAGTIGLFGVIPDYLDGANLTENAAKLIIKNKALDKYFLMHIGNSDLIKPQIGKLTHAVGVPKLALERIKMIEIPLPPIEVQSAIIENINNEMLIVDSNRKLIAIFEEKIKQVIARVWESE